jgi:hypothetical protein
MIKYACNSRWLQEVSLNYALVVPKSHHTNQKYLVITVTPFPLPVIKGNVIPVLKYSVMEAYVT